MRYKYWFLIGWSQKRSDSEIQVKFQILHSLPPLILFKDNMISIKRTPILNKIDTYNMHVFNM